MRQFATITVIGRDRTGVVARVTGFLFEQGANIEALEEQVTRGRFSMTIQASWRLGELQRDNLRKGLRQLGARLKMETRFRLTEPHRRQRCAIFATREQMCPAALVQAMRGGRLMAEPVLMIGNRPDLKSLAQQHKVPFHHIPWDVRDKAERRALDILDHHEIDFLVLARFMKILSPNFVWRYKNKIINIHPSLLPSFPGPQAYRQAHEHGVKIVGVTAHFVSMHLDEGPIIAQDCLRLKPNMSLGEIIAAGQKIEAKVLLKAVRLFLSRRLDVYWGTVKEV
ncbi:MAG TPA: formyltetrahydrofolate deformylase [Methylomirabilota bacterium]|nr:formyltetrahydrofolate deformylase [Methylomirabilota bacterium]